MSVEPNDFGFSGPAKKYSLTALKDNIGLLKIDTIEKLIAGASSLKKVLVIRLKKKLIFCLFKEVL
jgi:hypothetical protein